MYHTSSTSYISQLFITLVCPSEYQYVALPLAALDCDTQLPKFSFCCVLCRFISLHHFFGRFPIRSGSIWSWIFSESKLVGHQNLLFLLIYTHVFASSGDITDFTIFDISLLFSNQVFLHLLTVFPIEVHFQLYIWDYIAEMQFVGLFFYIIWFHVGPTSTGIS